MRSPWHNILSDGEFSFSESEHVSSEIQPVERNQKKYTGLLSPRRNSESGRRQIAKPGKAQRDWEKRRDDLKKKLEKERKKRQREIDRKQRKLKRKK